MEKEEATPFGNLFANHGKFFVITMLPYASHCGMFMHARSSINSCNSFPTSGSHACGPQDLKWIHSLPDPLLMHKVSTPCPSSKTKEKTVVSLTTKMAGQISN